MTMIPGMDSGNPEKNTTTDIKAFALTAVSMWMGDRIPFSDIG